MNKKNQTLKEKFALAFENYKKKDYKSAEFICNQILTIDENHFDSIFLLSTLSAIQGNFEKTKKFLKKAIEIEPKNFSAYNNLGNAEKYLGNLKEAINSYNKAMEINPNNPNSYFNTGIVHFES